MSSTTTATSVAANGNGSSELKQRAPLKPTGKYGPYNDPVTEPNLMRKIIAENCCMAGGTAAVLLQIANRGVGLGVSAHSSFTKRPVERARRSMQYIYGMTFGTVEERQIISDATHRAHSRVKGAGFDANDPDLQLWVAATMYWSLVTSYEEVYGPLPAEEADRVYDEFSVMATGLRVPKEKWPANRVEFYEYWDRMIPSLEITDEARATAIDVLYPKKNLPWKLQLYAYLTGPFTRITTTEMLPESARKGFGLESNLVTRWVHWALGTYNSYAYPWLPEGVRHFVKDYYMRDFRERVARGSRL